MEVIQQESVGWSPDPPQQGHHQTSGVCQQASAVIRLVLELQKELAPPDHI